MTTAAAGFNAVDGFVAALLLIGLISGTRRGLSGEAAILVATLISGVAAWKFSGWARALLLSNAGLSPREATVAGVVLVFVAVYFLLWVVRKALAAMMQFNFKGKAERIGGALCGLSRYTVFALILLLIATFIPNDKVKKAVGEESVIGSFVSRHVRPLSEDLARKNGVTLPAEPGTSAVTEVPAGTDAPPIREVEAAPPDVITNEVPAGTPLGPLER